MVSLSLSPSKNNYFYAFTQITLAFFKFEGEIKAGAFKLGGLCDLQALLVGAASATVTDQGAQDSFPCTCASVQWANPISGCTPKSGSAAEDKPSSLFAFTQERLSAFAAM